MHLARAIQFGECDTRGYANSTRTGAWCISGEFEFSNWGEGKLNGKTRKAFSNGWMGLETFGPVTFFAVTQIEESEINHLTDILSEHFVTHNRAPNIEAARPVAKEEIHQMQELCNDHDPNTLLTVARELSVGGVHESYRVIDTPEADLGQFAIHGSLDE